MDERIKHCVGLTERDIALLHQVENGLPLVADVSRADVLLCCSYTDGQILVLHHALPSSISSLYRQDTAGRLFSALEQPQVQRALHDGSRGRYQKQVLSDGAPVLQDIHPIHNAARQVIGVLVIEANMIEHERHRRRNKQFRKAVGWLQQMAARGELENAQVLSRFGPFDGVYLVNTDRQVVYLSGIATNLYRAIGKVSDLGRPHVSALEPIDEELVEQAFRAQCCLEMRHETADGRVWVRKVIPLRAPRRSWQQLRRRICWMQARNRGNSLIMDAALVLVHNATEMVQKQRELNVKSAMIQEIHHRVKNNLQTIAAMLRIQSRRCESSEARQHLLDAVNRVLSMSVIHEFLSQDGNHPINIRDVCKRIAVQVQQVASGPGQLVEIEVDGPNIRLPASQATATALVVNELLLNALEHGLRDRERGRIWLQLSDLGNEVQVVIQDDGAGLPSDFALDRRQSLGLQIIQTLVSDDLKGELTIRSGTEPQSPGSLPQAAAGSPAGPEPQGGDDLPIAELPTPLPPLSPDGSGKQEERAGPGTRASVRFPKRSLAAG